MNQLLRNNSAKVWMSLVGIAFSIAIRHGSAQQPAPQGSLRFANAAAIPGRVLFTIDGRKWRPDGFGPGENTAAIGVVAGPHRLGASNPAAKPIEVSSVLQPSTTSTIVAFTKTVIDPQTKQPVTQLQLFAQPDVSREKGKHFYFLYASGNRPTIDVVVNGQARSLPALRQIKGDDFARGSATVEVGGKPIVDFKAEENGTFTIIIFDKPDGSVGGMVLPDYS